MADSAVSLSFEQDWTCLSEGEIGLRSIGYSRMGQCIKNVTQLYTYKLMRLMWFHGYSASGFYKLRLGYKSWQHCEPGNLSSHRLYYPFCPWQQYHLMALLPWITLRHFPVYLGQLFSEKSLIFEVLMQNKKCSPVISVFLFCYLKIK